MNFAAELFLTTFGMIFFIVVVAEIGWKLLTHFGGDE
jgi:hypothetical protein